MKKKLVLLGLLLITPLLAYSCALMGIEKPEYQVVAKEGKFEVRQYEPQIIAETIVESDFDEAGNVAFRRLFDYISGENRTAESIKMTAPVNQKADSQKIAMTAPVNQQQAGGKYAVSLTRSPTGPRTKKNTFKATLSTGTCQSRIGEIDCRKRCRGRLFCSSRKMISFASNSLSSIERIHSSLHRYMGFKRVDMFCLLIPGGIR